ncbi:MAG: hypothetical protein GTN76_03520, partial [Candidatus Aenigmarchaeota archaeon]|nr:hypothetical protein [Candidatus Aenigmarchaeota archaeon]
ELMGYPTNLSLSGEEPALEIFEAGHWYRKRVLLTPDWLGRFIMQVWEVDVERVPEYSERAA